MKIRWNKFNIGSAIKRIDAGMEETKAISVRGKKMTFKPFRLGVILIAVVIAILIIAGIAGTRTKHISVENMNYEAGGQYTIMPYRNDVLMYNKQSLAVVDKKGRTLWQIKIAMAHPQVETAGKYILVTDLGGKNYAALYKEENLIYEFNIGNDIISSKVNEDGDTAFATDVVGYKGCVKVYDKNGKEKFIWNSGDGYITDIALNDTGRKLVVAQLVSSGEQTKSCVRFIDVARKKISHTVERDNSLIGELKYHNGQIIAVADNEVCFISGSGRLKNVVSFFGKKPGKYDISGNNILAFTTIDNRGHSVLELYSTSGRLKGSYRAESGINNIAVCENNVVIAKNRNLICISSRGREKNQISCNSDIKVIGSYGDEHRVFAAGTTGADILRIK